MRDAIGTVAFLGAGTMAEAILARGIVRPEQAAASHPRAARRDELAARYGVRMVEHNRAAGADADLAEAIYQMEKGGLRTVLSKAVHAAYQRTLTLRTAQEQD